jgi:hypothetical protein
MKKLLFAAAIAVGATAASAQEVSPYIQGLGVVVNNDVEYSIENETFTTEPELVISAYGASAYASAGVDAEEIEVTDATFGISYDLNIQGVTLTPYFEYLTDGDFENTDMIVGVSTSIKLY